MNPMNLAQITAAAPALYRAGVSVHLIGAPGLGKSAVAETVAAEMSRTSGKPFGLLEVLMPTWGETDFAGIPMPAKDQNNKLVIVRARPPFIPTPDNIRVWVDGTEVDRANIREVPEDGLLLLDEFQQAGEAEKKLASQLLHLRRIGEFRLPGKWAVWLTSNRAKDRSGVTKALAMIQNRTVEVSVEFDADTLVAYATKSGWHPDVVSFIGTNPYLFATEVPTSGAPFLTPRSMEKAMQVALAFAEPPAEPGGVPRLSTDDTVINLMAGAIGAEAATAFRHHLIAVSELPALEDVIADPDKTRLPKKTLHLLAAWAWAFRVKRDTVGKVLRYLSREGMLEEASHVFVARIINNPALATAREVQEWLRTKGSDFIRARI